MEHKRFRHRAGKAFAFIFLVPLFILGASAAIWQLWNWLMPDLFGFKQIEFLQALGLFALSRLLFAGRRGWGGRGKRNWKNRMRKRFYEERAHKVEQLGV